MGEIALRPANAIDEKILRLADGHSPEEISIMLRGVISAKAIAARTQVLLRSKNWLDAAQQDQLITHRMNKVLLELEDRFMDIENAGMRLKYLKEIGSRLDRRTAATEIDLQALYGNQARLMAQAINLAFERALLELQKRVPALGEAEVRDVLTLALPEAITVISELNRGDAIDL